MGRAEDLEAETPARVSERKALTDEAKTTRETPTMTGFNIYSGRGKTREEATVKACAKADTALKNCGGTLKSWVIEEAYKVRRQWTVRVSYTWEFPKEPAL